jgi:hypothetical protein
MPFRISQIRWSRNLTSDNHPPKIRVKHRHQLIIPALCHIDRWIGPLFYVGLKEIVAVLFRTRGDCLVPRSGRCDSEIAREKESQDPGKLGSYKEECSICRFKLRI